MNKKSLILVFACFLLVLSLNSSEAQNKISKLLKEYEKAEIQKTVDKTLGKVYVFSREDIERLQLNTVADLLKLLPIGTVYPNGFGVIQWDITTEKTSHIQTSVRIYLDGHELSSIHTLSPFLTYDEFPLDNIQKAEIYFSNSINELSTENGAIIVKLYSKDPKKENIALIKGLMDSKNGYSLSFSDARQLTRDFGYFVLFNKGEKNYDKISSKSNSLNRDQKRKHLYMKFNYIDTEIQISVSNVKRGIWGGFSPDFSPDFGKMSSTDVFFSISQKMLEDKSLKLVASYDWQRRNYLEQNSDFGVYFSKYVNQGKAPLYLDEEATFTKFNLYVLKEFKFKAHYFKVGIIHQNYEQNAEGKKFIYPPNNVIKDYEPKHEENDYFSSAFLKYQCIVNNNLSLFAEGKVSYYDWFHNKDKLVFDKKLGFIRKSNKLIFKGYLSESHMPLSLILLEAKKSSQNLKPLKIQTAYLEANYNISDSQKIGGFTAYTTIQNTLEPTPEGFVNGNKKYENYLFDINYSYNLENINVKTELWHTYSANYSNFSPSTGADFIINGKIGNINYFTTFLYRNGFKYKNIKVDSSYDLSLGAGYEFKNGFSLKIKGENILNSSAETVYTTPVSSGTYKSFDRRFIITLEKVF